MFSAISLVWELPLAIGSRLALVIVRFFLRRLARIHYRRAGSEAVAWRLLDEQLLQRRFALPVVMTEGPRWNTHAIIGRVGPLSVRNGIEVQVSQAEASASSWTIVVYSFPDHRTIAALGPEDGLPDKQWATVSLPGGRYSLILRYYDPTPAATLPAVRADGHSAVASTPVPSNTNAFYEHLSQRRNILYAMLHYHAFVALKYRSWLPRRLVERVYLPVGNPETLFHYGALQPRDSLHLEISQRVLDSWDAYITVYDIASFPVTWQRIESTDFQLEPFRQRCTFLIRLHRQSTTASVPRENEIRIELQRS